MEKLWLDIKYSLYRFSKEPISVAVMVLTLALSIGASTAIFSVVNGLVLQALPFEQSGKFLQLRVSESSGAEMMGSSAPEIYDMRDQVQYVDELAEYHSMTFTMFGAGEPKQVKTGVVSANFFEMLSIEPHLGRFFEPGEDELGAEPLVLLTYEFWLSEFNAQEDVIDTSLEMNNRLHKVIGVLPRFAQFPEVNDVYMAVPSCPWRSSEMADSSRETRFLDVFGKISKGSNFKQVNAELSNIADNFLESYPDAYDSDTGYKLEALKLADELVKDIKVFLYILLGTTVFVLLIASANVANLTLSRLTKRRRELAVRMSLGAGRSAIARQLLTESLLIALAAGVIGLALTFIGKEQLIGLVAQFNSRANEISIDTNVLIFSMVLSIFAGLITGILPSFTKVNLITELKEGGKATQTTTQQPVKNTLLMLQVAFSLTLIVSAGLTIKSLANINNVDLGYDPENVHAQQMDLNWSEFENGTEIWQFSDQILERLANTPGVESSAIAQTYPMDKLYSGAGKVRDGVIPEGGTQAKVFSDLHARYVSFGYFQTLGISLASGRVFTDRDTADAEQVIILGKLLAEALWPEETNIVGNKLSFDEGENWLTVVGIANNVRELDPRNSDTMQVYYPMAQVPRSHLSVLVKSEREDIEQVVKEIVYSINERQPVDIYETLTQAQENLTAVSMFIATLLTFFALISVLITISGIGAVMAYLVSVRNREIGIRMAIGASKTSILGTMVGYSAGKVIFGVLLGLFVSLLATKFLQDLLFNIAHYDVYVYILSVLGVLAIAICAAVVPAIKAMSVSPMAALKTN